MTLKFLIADDHELYRDALSLLLRSHFAGCEVVQAHDHQCLLDKATGDTNWSAFLVDLHMPGMVFQSAIKALKQAFPEVPVIIISSSEMPADTEQALKAGAVGYILKSMNNEEIQQALTLIIERGLSLYPHNSKPYTENQQSTQLTPRQQEVLNRMAQGDSNKRIALDMELSESTVKIHVRAILNALGAANRTEAVIKSRQFADNQR